MEPKERNFLEKLLILILGTGILVVYLFIFFVNKWIKFLLIIALLIWLVQKDEWIRAQCFRIFMILMFLAMISIEFNFIDATCCYLLYLLLLTQCYLRLIFSNCYLRISTK